MPEFSVDRLGDLFRREEFRLGLTSDDRLIEDFRCLGLTKSASGTSLFRFMDEFRLGLVKSAAALSIIRLTDGNLLGVLLVSLGDAKKSPSDRRSEVFRRGLGDEPITSDSLFRTTVFFFGTCSGVMKSADDRLLE